MTDRLPQTATANGSHDERADLALADLVPCVVWTARPDGLVDYANQFWVRFTGLSIEKSLGSGWSAALHPDDAPRVTETWARALDVGEPVDLEYRLRRDSDGAYRWFLARGVPVRDPDGRIVKWFGTLTDIDAQKRAENEVQRQHGLARLLHEVTVAAYQADTVEQAMQVVLDRVCAFTGWPVGHVYVVRGADAPELVPSSVWHLDTPGDFARFREVTAATPLAPGAGLPGRVFLRKEPVWIADVTRDGNFPRNAAARDLGVKGACGVPVLAVGGVVAVLEFFTREPSEPDEPLRQALFQIGIQLGHAFDRNRAVADLEQAKAAAEAANRAKSDFLSRMSHELRTPLNAILGFGQLLEMGSPSPRQKQQLDQILKGGRHLVELINEVLDLARIEAGQLQLTFQAISVRQACTEVCELVVPLAERLRVRVDDGVGPDLHVRADNQRLKQVLLNLLSNGAKYNHPGGSVSLTWEEIPPNRVRLSVRDTGPGIAPEMHQRLFNPFDRLGAEATGVEGTGLGLVLSKRLTEAMGGSLRLISDRSGTTASVELPLWDEGAVRKLATRTDLDFSILDPSSFQEGTVLYIEDNAANLSLMNDLFAYRPGARLLSATLGIAGLELARRHQPDLILLDAHLPDMPGEEVLRQLRSDARLAGIPVIVISADATPPRMERFRAAGVSEYLTKPLDVPRFLALLDQFLRQRQVGP